MLEQDKMYLSQSRLEREEEKEKLSSSIIMN